MYLTTNIYIGTKIHIYRGKYNNIIRGNYTVDERGALPRAKSVRGEADDHIMTPHTKNSSPGATSRGELHEVFLES